MSDARALGGGAAWADETEEPAVITQKTLTARTYQGQDNWYYLCGDFASDNLYRMYFNHVKNWWQGNGGYANFLNQGGNNTMYPINSDVVMAYVVPTYADISMVGRILSSISTTDEIGVKIIHRHKDGDTVIEEHTLVNQNTEKTYNVARQTVHAAAGDVIFFLAEKVDGLTAWNGATFDIAMTITEVGGEAVNPESLLEHSAMPMTGAHNITVTNNVINYHSILTESMKLKQTDNQRYCYKNKDGSYGLFTYSGETGVDENGNPKYSSVYTTAGGQGQGSSIGIEAARVFYSNNGAFASAGMLYYAPATGKTSLLGKAVVKAGANALIVKLNGQQETLLKTVSGPQEIDFAQVAEANNVSIQKGEALAVIFDAAAWNTSSMAAAFDFYTDPDMYVRVDEVKPTCTEGGNIGYYIHGGKNYTDKTYTTEVDTDEIPVDALGHNLSAVAEKAPTCTEAGNVACYKCSRCEGYFEDADGNTEKTDYEVSATGHTITLVEEVAATCASTGTAEHYHCSGCNLDFEDGEGNTPATDLTIAKLAHTPETDEAVAATCTTTGLTEGSHCSVCNEVITAQTEVAMIAHNYSEGKCTVCEAADPDYTAPGTTEPGTTEPSTTEPGDNTGDNSGNSTGDGNTSGGDTPPAPAKKKCGSNMQGSATVAAVLMAAMAAIILTAKKRNA